MQVPMYFCTIFFFFFFSLLSPPHFFLTSAVLALQEASEAFLIGLLEYKRLCATHAKFVTIMVRHSSEKPSL